MPVLSGTRHQLHTSCTDPRSNPGVCGVAAWCRAQGALTAARDALCGVRRLLRERTLRRATSAAHISLTLDVTATYTAANTTLRKMPLIHRPCSMERVSEPVAMAETLLEAPTAMAVSACDAIRP